MDPKKKKLYIILIIVCVVLSVGIVLWSRISTSSNESFNQSLITITSNVQTNQNLGNPKTGYSAPSVFPANEKFLTEVLDSKKYQSLRPYTLLDITGQLGRPDPFGNY